MNVQKRDRDLDPILLFVDLNGSGPTLGASVKQWWDLPEAGSGGYIPAPNKVRRVLTGTGGKVALGEARTANTTSATEDASELLRLVRIALSLNVTELAAAVGVERPTVYSWLADKSRPQSANRNRLSELADVARYWKRIAKRPLGRLVREPLPSGATVVGLLQEAEIPQAALIEQLQHLATLVVEPRRVRPAREVAQALGVAEQHEDELEVATGKRFDAD